MTEWKIWYTIDASSHRNKPRGSVSHLCVSTGLSESFNLCFHVGQNVEKRGYERLWKESDRRFPKISPADVQLFVVCCLFPMISSSQFWILYSVPSLDCCLSGAHYSKEISVRLQLVLWYYINDGLDPFINSVRIIPAFWFRPSNGLLLQLSLCAQEFSSDVVWPCRRLREN